MGACLICRTTSSRVSEELALCLDCIRASPRESLDLAAGLHAGIRRQWGLPEEAPRHAGGIPCNLCVNHCVIGEGGAGYCGVRRNVRGRIEGVSVNRGKLSWYHDPLPTNCVAGQICPGGSECGYPAYSLREGPEFGYSNLAVFPHACTFNCLYCQNWHFRRHTLDGTFVAPESLVDAVGTGTTCICHFGGDPSAQMPFLLEASRGAREKKGSGILRVCWETNGAMSKGMALAMARVSLASGGCIKIDLKAWDETLHRVLTGVTNTRTLENFEMLAGMIHLRPDPPLLAASTLMLPGYVNADEVSAIASFISSLDPGIPYSLLAFHPGYRMGDLPYTSREMAESCLKAAHQAGLHRVRLGNRHLIGWQ